VENIHVNATFEIAGHGHEPKQMGSSSRIGPNPLQCDRAVEQSERVRAGVRTLHLAEILASTETDYHRGQTPGEGVEATT